MTGRLCDRGTNFHVLLCVRASNSSFMASIHSSCLIAEKKVTGLGGIDDD